MLRYSFLVALLTTVGVPSADACQTITTLIAKVRPNPVEIYRMRELLPVSLGTLAERADRVVEGRIAPVKTYLSDDGCYLLTDFAVSVSTTIAGSTDLPSQPGPPLVFTQFGGEDTIDGIKVTVQDKEAPLLRAGQHVIVFLRESTTTKKLELAGLAGAFEVIDERVVPLVRETVVQDMISDRAMFISKVRQIHTRRK
jgi:hypothetical protein